MAALIVKLPPVVLPDGTVLDDPHWHQVAPAVRASDIPYTDCGLGASEAIDWGYGDTDCEGCLYGGAINGDR